VCVTRSRTTRTLRTAQPSRGCGALLSRVDCGARGGGIRLERSASCIVHCATPQKPCRRIALRAAMARTCACPLYCARVRAGRACTTARRGQGWDREQGIESPTRLPRSRAGPRNKTAARSGTAANRCVPSTETSVRPGRPLRAEQWCAATPTRPRTAARRCTLLAHRMHPAMPRTAHALPSSSPPGARMS